MAATFVAITISAIFVSGVISGVVGLVTAAIHHEEHDHTLTRAAPSYTACAARGLNGVYVRTPRVRQASHRRHETPAQHPHASSAADHAANSGTTRVHRGRCTHHKETVMNPIRAIRRVACIMAGLAVAFAAAVPAALASTPPGQAHPGGSVEAK